MPSIQLKAKLRAYTRAPFYNDYVRDTSTYTIENFNKGTSYVRKDGQWVELNESIPTNYVKRTLLGNVTTGESINDEDTINRKEFEDWQQNTKIETQEILDIINNYYIPELNFKEDEVNI